MIREAIDRGLSQKPKDLEELLSRKKVDLKVSRKALALLTKKGTSREYGARNMDRIIQNEIKTLFVDELLFGDLKKGGSVRIEAEEDRFRLKIDAGDRKPSADDPD